MAVFLLNEPPTGITPSSAFLKVLKATLSGPSTATCIFYYGTSDGGTVEGNWQFSANAGAHGDTEFGVTVSNLADHEIYYFRVKAVQDLGGGTSETSWSSSAQEFSTLSYPQKVCGSCVTRAMTPVAALSGRWSDSLCPASTKEHFRGGITQMYGVTHSHLQLTTHTTIQQHYTVPNLSWNTTQPFNSTYIPPSVSGAQVQGDTAFTIGLTPAAFDALQPSDKQFWAMKKGAWKLTASININANFFNTNPGAGGAKGGPYTTRFSMFPYSVYLRPKRALPPFNYTTTIPNSGAVLQFPFILRSDCFWFCNLTVEVWAGQTNQIHDPPVTDVDIATVDAQLVRNPPNA